MYAEELGQHKFGTPRRGLIYAKERAVIVDSMVIKKNLDFCTCIFLVAFPLKYNFIKVIVSGLGT